MNRDKINKLGIHVHSCEILVKIKSKNVNK